MEKLINMLFAEEGYCEKKSNSQLYEKTANAGSKNWTKYSDMIDRHPEVLNGKKNGIAAWCAIFVIVMAALCYGWDSIFKIFNLPKKSAAASCTYLYSRIKTKLKSPKVGCLAFWGDGEKFTHVGYVIAVSGKKFTTIEGNKKNKVSRCTYDIGTSGIYFANPNWPTNKKDNYKVQVSTYLSLRTGAGTHYRELAKMLNNETILVSEIKGNWAHCTYNGIEGFCHIKYIKEIK